MAYNALQPVKPRPVFDQSHPTPSDATGDTPKRGAQADVTADAQPTPKTTKGQKHFAPLGRHSQQSHRRAQERASELGHTTEKEQHAHDRSVVVARLNKQAAQQLKQQQSVQNKRSGIQNETAQERPQE